MQNVKEEFISTAHYIGQEFSPPDRSYEFVSSQIVSHDDFKQDTYVYVTWKRVTTDETDQMSFWDEESEKE